MSNYQKYTPAQRKAWGKKMAAARAAKASSVGGKGAYYRRPAAYTGRGAYKSAKSRKTRATARNYGGLAGGAIGTALGGPTGGAIGQALGSGVGHMVGEAIKYFTGKGDYQVVNNSFLTDGGAGITPIRNPHHSGGDVFRREEYLGDLISSGTANTFKVQSFPVNPGLEASFEWLSQVACNYEEYEFEGLYFEFRSTSADALNSVNTALGQVVMAANYNAASPNFTNKQQMENYEGGISGKPSCSIRYFVECAKNKTVLSELFVRQGAVPSGQDQRLYDLCNFQIATNGMQGTQVNCGEIWIAYQVVLRKPKLFAALGYYNGYGQATPSNGQFTNALPLGSSGAWNYSTNNSIPGFLVTGTLVWWNVPTIPQQYILSVQWVGVAAAAFVAPTLTALPNSGLIVRASQFVPLSGTDTSTYASVLVILTYQPTLNTIGSPVTYLTFGAAGTLPSGAAGAALNIYMMQVPNGYGI